jgi:hypothetical protein
MVRKTFKTVLLVLLAVFSLSAIGEAAPGKVVRHRIRHTRRVSAAAAKGVKKKTVHVTRHAGTATRRAAVAAASTTKRVARNTAASTTKRVARNTASTTKRVARNTGTTTKRVVVKRKTTTKPR